MSNSPEAVTLQHPVEDIDPIGMELKAYIQITYYMYLLLHLIYWSLNKMA